MGLTADQAAAVEALRGHRVARLTGLAGTGKTWLSLRLPELLGWTGPVLFAAPTHRAGSVLMRKAIDAGIKIEVGTAWAATKGAPTRTKHCSVCPGDARCHVRTHDVRCPVCGSLDADSAIERDVAASYDHVIMDESSMLTKRDYSDLMAQLSGLSNILFVGDPGQLPPVDPANPDWSCLRSVDMPEATLTAIQRTAQDSPIVYAAHAVRGRPGRGNQLFAGSDWWVPGQVEHALGIEVPAGHGQHNAPELCDSVILTNWNVTRVALNAQVRTGLFSHLYGGKIPPLVIGDIVRCRYQEKSSRPDRLTKDQLGQVMAIRSQGSKATVADLRMETGREVTAETLLHADLSAPKPLQSVRWMYGHTMTVHASQGSEFRQVTYCVSGNDKHDMAYTALTRARERVIVVPAPS